MTRKKDNLLRLSEVIELSGLSKSAIERMVRADSFPRPLRVGPRSTRWLERDVRHWLISQYDPAVSHEPMPPRKKGRAGFIHEGLLVSQAPAHDRIYRSASVLSRHVIHVDDLSLCTAGIYFLWRGNVIVYVGQTRAGFGRIATHIAQSQKVFDGVSFLRCEADQLDEVERKYIDRFMPEYNADSITLAAKRRREGYRRAHFQPSPVESRGLRRHEKNFGGR